jgi:hypothetical protein
MAPNCLMSDLKPSAKCMVLLWKGGEKKLRPMFHPLLDHKEKSDIKRA